MYKELIEDNTKTEVELKPNFGKRHTYFDKPLVSIMSYRIVCSIILLLRHMFFLLSNQHFSLLQVPSPSFLRHEAEELLNKQFDMTLLKPMAYQNTYALAVKKSFADEHQLKKISDLAAVSDQIKAGFTLEFIDRCWK